MRKVSVSSLGFERFSGLYVWALFIIVFGALSPNLFLTTDNMQSIAVAQATTAMLGLAVVIPLATGLFDLSVGANAQFCAVLVCIAQTRWDLPMWPAIGLTVVTAIGIGAFNAFVVVVLKVSAFIATLATATLLAAAQTIVTDNLQPVPVVNDTWTNLTQSKILGVQSIVCILLVVAIVLWWVLERMPAGRYMRAVGSNETAARLSGVKVGRYQALSLTLCGAVAGVAGVAYASNVGPSLTFGNALLLPAYAAAFLGFTQITPGRFNIIGALVAVYVLATGVQGLAYQTSVQWLGDTFNGVTLISAVAFAGWRQQARLNRRGLSRRRGLGRLPTTRSEDLEALVTTPAAESPSSEMKEGSKQ